MRAKVLQTIFHTAEQRNYEAGAVIDLKHLRPAEIRVLEVLGAIRALPDLVDEQEGEAKR